MKEREMARAETIYDCVEAYNDTRENCRVDLLASAYVESVLGVLSPEGRRASSMARLYWAASGLFRDPSVLTHGDVSPAVRDAVVAHIPGVELTRESWAADQELIARWLRDGNPLV